MKAVENHPPFVGLVNTHVMGGLRQQQEDWQVKENFFNNHIKDKLMVRSGSGKLKRAEPRENEEECIIF